MLQTERAVREDRPFRWRRARADQSSTFTVTVAEGKVAIRRGRSDAAQFTLSAPDAMTIAGAVYGKLPLSSLKGLTVQGKAALLRRCVGLFHLPKKIV